MRINSTTFNYGVSMLGKKIEACRPNYQFDTRCSPSSDKIPNIYNAIFLKNSTRML